MNASTAANTSGVTSLRKTSGIDSLGGCFPGEIDSEKWPSNKARK